ncbi:MAG: hypothetical protein A2020_01380 [Lentisphaerae bacterium GWF2_45_14]|nr:MAG: hypothetical protein A2020_01380 [Lentisphaerae bacterium GWF2_45_14]
MKDFKNLKILVIEDTEDVFNFHKRWISHYGAAFIGSMTGKDGIEIVKAHSDIDIIILDMVLPDIEGNKVYEEIRKINPEVPVIVCSGYHDKIGQMGLKYKVKVLYKPFLLPALQEMITELCNLDEDSKP